jgi:hypothetical protein
MKMWRPTWDTLVTLLGVALLIVITLRGFLPANIGAPLMQPGTLFIAVILCGIVLLGGVAVGTLRHKEAAPMIFSGLGILSLLLPLPTSNILIGIGVISFVSVAILSVLFRQHSLDIPRAPSMDDLMQNAL